jgi:hypothetical protein
LASHTAVKRHNSRFGKKLDPVAMMTRKKGACVLCRHYNKKVCRPPTNAMSSFLTDNSSAIGLPPKTHVRVASR